MDKQQLLKTLKIIGIVSLLLISIPIIFFIFNFSGNTISDDIAKWGSFGDFFGGIINTVLSLASLIILGYLTYFLHTQSIEENKKSQFLIKRVEAYQELTSLLPEIHKMNFDLAQNLNSITRTLSVDGGRTESLIRFENNTKAIVDFYSLLVTFEDRFSTLFAYDFKSFHFKQLCLNVLALRTYITKTVLAYETLSEGSEITFEMFTEFHQNLDIVLAALQEELK